MVGVLWAGLWMTAAQAEDPWGRPSHLRVVPAPPTRWAERAAPPTIRVWWDGETRGDIAVARGGRWRVVATSVSSGVSLADIPWDAQVRVRLQGSTRWSPVMTVDPISDPLSTGRLGEWGRGADVVGEVSFDPRTGDVVASTVGGGLLWRSAVAQPGAEGGLGAGEWRVLGRFEGMPDAKVLSVAVQDGTVWAGTAKGLVALRDAQVIAVHDTDLVDPYVQAVAGTADGSLWVGTYRGLSVRRPGAATFETILSPWSVFSLNEARGGGVWAGYEGVQKITADGEVETWATNVHAYDILDTPTGPLVATTEHGVLRLHAPDAGESLSPLVDREAFGVAWAAGGLWTAAGGLGLVDPQNAAWGHNVGLPSDEVRSVLGLPDGSLWVGTDAGLARVLPRPQGPPVVDVAERSRWPAMMSVRDLAATDAGIWVVGNGGLTVAGAPHRFSRNLQVAAGANVTAVAVGDAGDVWAVGDRVLHLDRAGVLSAWWAPAPLTVGAFQPGVGLFVGGPDGLWRLDSHRGRFVLVPGIREVSSMAASAVGLWVSSGANLFRVMGGTVRPFFETPQPLSVSAVGSDVWVGSVSGLLRLQVTEGDIEVVDVLGDADLGVAVPAVAGVHDGVWFAAEDGTIGRVAGQRWGGVALDVADAPTPTKIVPDGDFAWVGTEQGVYRVFLPVSQLSEQLPDGRRGLATGSP